MEYTKSTLGRFSRSRGNRTWVRETFFTPNRSNDGLPSPSEIAIYHSQTPSRIFSKASKSPYQDHTHTQALLLNYLKQCNSYLMSQKQCQHSFPQRQKILALYLRYEMFYSHHAGRATTGNAREAHSFQLDSHLGKWAVFRRDGSKLFRSNN
jgi:hypothetical protein